MANLSFRDLRALSALTAVFLLLAMAFLGSALPARAGALEPDAEAAEDARLSDTQSAQRLAANLPLHFIENHGQVDRRADYYLQGRDKVIYFTGGGMTVVLYGPRRQSALPAGSFGASVSDAGAEVGVARWALQLEFVGADTAVRPSGENPSAALISYFSGPAGQWRPAVKNFTRLVYADLWPGIDLVFNGASNQLKYLFLVKPGADPAAIKLRYRGAESVVLNRAGQLTVRTPLADLTDDKPTAYQQRSAEVADIAVAYDLQSSLDGDFHQYGFKLGGYDRSLPLIIDPAIFVYSGFIGGSGDDRGNAIAVDGDGNAYITGETNSLEATFPDVAGPDRSSNGSVDAFVAKVNAAGTALIYAGFIGGSGVDRGKAIAVDSAGNAYIAGDTTSNQSSFPVTIGPDLTHNGGTDGFVAKVNADGTALIYAGFIGGIGTDRGNAIAVDGSNRAYVAGATDSQATSFPGGSGFGALPSFDVVESGGVDGFVARVAADGTALEYASYLGGLFDDQVFGIAVDGAGAAYLTGETNSSGATFPVTGALDAVENGGVDGFAAKVNPAGTALIYAGFLGGAGDDRGKAIAIPPGCAANCEAYIAGETSSTQASFPVTVGPDLTHNGGVDGFVARVNAAGSALVYAGYVGGNGTDRANGIAVDSSGIAHIAGETDSTQVTFPDGDGFGVLTSSDKIHNGAIDAFVAAADAAGTALLYASYIGGAGNDRGKGIAVDDNGDIYITGETDANSVSFPGDVAINSRATIDARRNGGVDAFAIKICVTVCHDLQVSQVDSPDPVRVGDSVTYTITVINKGPDSATNVVLTDLLPVTVTLVSATPSSGACAGVTTVTCALGNLADEASATVVIVATTSAKGTVSNLVTVVADETETNSRNNRDVELTVATFANLTVRSLTAPAAVLPGATIDLDDTTQNSGTVDATSGTLTRFYLSSDGKTDGGDSILGTRAVPALAKKQSSAGTTSVTIPGGTALGRYFIIAAADDDAAVVETSERNQRSRRITVTRPDLVVSALRSPPSAIAGASIAIQDTTRNDDLVGAGATTTEFYLSTDKIFDGGDVLLGSRAVPALGTRAPSVASTTVTIPATAPGRYFIIAVADAAAAVVESDETNNARSHAFTVK